MRKEISINAVVLCACFALGIFISICLHTLFFAMGGYLWESQLTDPIVLGILLGGAAFTLRYGEKYKNMAIVRNPLWLYYIVGAMALEILKHVLGVAALGVVFSKWTLGIFLGLLFFAGRLAKKRGMVKGEK
jgi:hypothetical protein